MNVQIEAITISTYMPAAPIAARCHLLGSIQESDTLQYRQGVSTRNITPISWHSPPKCLHVSPWPNSWMTLVTASVSAQVDPVLGLEELVERGQLGVKRVELHGHQQQGRQRQQPRRRCIAGTLKNQRTLGYSQVEDAVRDRCP